MGFVGLRAGEACGLIGGFNGEDVIRVDGNDRVVYIGTETLDTDLPIGRIIGCTADVVNCSWEPKTCEFSVSQPEGDTTLGGLPD